MKTLKTIALLFCLAVGASACHDLEGDNSDFDLGFASGNGGSNPYVDGYDRLDNSLRLATYNTHRCEGPITQNPAYDRAHYDMTAKVISLVAPDAIALQELDEKTSWHPVSQIRELANRTGMYATFVPSTSGEGSTATGFSRAKSLSRPKYFPCRTPIEPKPASPW